MSSAQESEPGDGYINVYDAVPSRTTLEEMKHHQVPAPIKFDKKCATGVVNDTVTQHTSKSMDMCWYWLCEKVHQKKLHIQWNYRESKLANYPMKNPDMNHHIVIRPTYVLNNLISFFTNLPPRVC